MDSIVLGAVNDSIRQLNFRIDDLNNRINEINKNVRNAEKQVDQVHMLISSVDKQTSLNKQKIDNHIKSHNSEDKRREIMGVRITSLIGNFGSAIIGAGLMLYIYYK